MPDLRQRLLRRSTTDLIIGTSRTKYMKPSNVGAAVHSYRGENLLDLFSLIERYPVQKLNTVIIIAGYNDYRDRSKSFVCNWKYLIQLVHWKFQPSFSPKPFQTTNIRASAKKSQYRSFKLLESIKPPSLTIIYYHLT